MAGLAVAVPISRVRTVGTHSPGGAGVDLHAHFGVERSADRSDNRVLGVEAHGRPFWIRADATLDIVSGSAVTRHAVPALLDGHLGDLCVSGLLVRAKEVALLLDTAALYRVAMRKLGGR